MINNTKQDLDSFLGEKRSQNLKISTDCDCYVRIDKISVPDILCKGDVYEHTGTFDEYVLIFAETVDKLVWTNFVADSSKPVIIELNDSWEKKKKQMIHQDSMGNVPTTTVILTADLDCMVVINANSNEVLEKGIPKVFYLPQGDNHLSLSTKDNRIVNKVMTLVVENNKQIVRELQIAADWQRVVEEKKCTISDLSLVMLPIKRGSFMMGSPSSEEDRYDDETQHQVTLSKDFWMSETPVTQKQHQKIMGTNPSDFEGDNRPVEKVSWDDAVSFCKKLTDRERAAGRLPAGFVYRLPTEAEWEYCCRAGTTGAYAGNLEAMAWYGGNCSTGSTHGVATKKPNAWGLYDMHGNVWEWCHDWCGRYPAGPVIDPQGATSGSLRVGRGGGWNGGSGECCRSAARNGLAPDFSDDALGFRMVLSQ